MLPDVFLNSYTIPDITDELDGDIQPISSFLNGHSIEISKNNILFVFLITSILGISHIENEIKDSLIDQLNSCSLENVINQTIFLFKYNGDVSNHVKVLANSFTEKMSSDEEEAETLYKNLPLPLFDLMFQQKSINKK